MPYFVASFPTPEPARPGVPSENACVCQGLGTSSSSSAASPPGSSSTTRPGSAARATGLHHQALPSSQRPLGFEYQFCNSYPGHEKGVRGEQRSDAEEEPLRPGPAGVDVDGTTRDCWRGRATSRRSTTGRGGRAQKLFEDDLAAMLALPAHPFECVEYRRARADKKGQSPASMAGTGTRRRPSAPGGRWSSGSGRRGSQ